MKQTVNRTVIELVQGDITTQDVEAIVNAANSSLLGGGGVDGAIHRAGGVEILKECKTLNGCQTGDAKITTGGKLKAGHVIHTVGPVYRDGMSGEPDLLASCYQRSLEVAVENSISSVAFPSVSTGVYGYPYDDAAEIALSTVKAFVEQNTAILLVRFVLFNEPIYQAFENAMKKVMI
jgi:O-acetyl-ADP-ribose deacetylase